MLLNLLGNAVKFTEAGRVTLRVSGRQQALDRGREAEEQGESVSPAPLPPAAPPRLPPTIYRLLFEVEDTGPGISPADQVRIFQPFEQGGETARQVEGTGLGLAISRQLVRLMDSDLHLESPLLSPLHWGRSEGDPSSPAGPVLSEVEGAIEGGRAVVFGSRCFCHCQRPERSQR